MPLSNPFRRQPERPSLRDRAADLSARLASTIRKPVPAPEPDPAGTVEDFAGIELHAYEFDFPIKSPQEWATQFSDRALMLHLADRTLRMTKAELMAFIREAGERDPATPEIMFRGFDGAQETLAGWSNLLGLARARYIVAASAACLEPDTSGVTKAEAPEATAASAEDSFPAAPTDLADACLWAVRHRAWIDQAEPATGWSDERGDAEAARTSAVITRAINEPSTNLREITAKAALALEDFERFTIISPDRKQDDGTRIVHTVLREIVGVGREAGSPSIPAPDSDLTAAILDGWKEWGSLQGITDDAVQSEADARRRALIHAAMALPATPENITAKALACAWTEWVETERPGQSRDAYGPADQLVYDIHAAAMVREPQETAAQLAPPAFDFGPDTHIAELAAEFCEAYAANIRTDREHMAGRMSEAEWLPHYRRTAELMDRLEATEPKTLLGMALKCLGPIGAAGYNAPADENEPQDEPWERAGTQFADAVLRGALVPFLVRASTPAGRDLCREAFDYAYGLDLSAVPLNSLLRIADVLHREHEVLRDVAQESQFYSNPDLRIQDCGGEIIEAESNRLGCLRDVCIAELDRRTPETEADRDAILVARVHHEMLCETKIRSKALLAEIRKAWSGE